MANMTCNIDTGVCEVNLDFDISKHTYQAPIIKDKVLVEYFTDPLCSACFIFEPVIDELLELFGSKIDFKVVMGGLMPSNNFSEQEALAMSKNIEATGERFNMGMSGKAMLDNPVSSSYPPSLAYLAVKKQSPSKALIYLRRLREAIYLEELDISKEAVLSDLARELDLDMDRFMLDFYSSQVLEELEADIAYTIMNGVSGFPSIVIYDLNGKSVIIRSYNDIKVYIDALAKSLVYPDVKVEYSLDNVLTSDYYLSERVLMEKLNLYDPKPIHAAYDNNDDVIKLTVSHKKYYRLKEEAHEV